MIAEPMTVFTDSLLAAFAGWIAWRLRQATAPRVSSRRLWAWGIAMQGLGALAGGIYHGLGPAMSPEIAAGWWVLTRIFLGLATSLLVSAIGFASLSIQAARVLAGLVGLKFLFYVWWCSQSSEFLPALTDQIASTVLLIGLLLYGGRRLGAMAGWIAVGLMAILWGGVIQYFRLAPHPHFNHNDLYHVFALISLGCFYGAGRKLGDYAVSSAPK